jgi:hypothetical protein
MSARTRPAVEYRRWKHGVVRVLARVENYAMVRYKGSAPFVVRIFELEEAPRASGYDDKPKSAERKP